MTVDNVGKGDAREVDQKLTMLQLANSSDHTHKTTIEIKTAQD